MNPRIQRHRRRYQKALSPSSELWTEGKKTAIADGVMLVLYVCKKFLLNLFGTVFRYFAVRWISALVAFKKYF